MDGFHRFPPFSQISRVPSVGPGVDAVPTTSPCFCSAAGNIIGLPIGTDRGTTHRLAWTRASAKQSGAETRKLGNFLFSLSRRRRPCLLALDPHFEKRASPAALPSCRLTPTVAFVALSLSHPWSAPPRCERERATQATLGISLLAVTSPFIRAAIRPVCSERGRERGVCGLEHRPACSSRPGHRWRARVPGGRQARRDR